MMPKIGNCRLCPEQGVSLQASHILPEFLYKRVYTRKHKFRPMSADSSLEQKFEQKGYREFLLCSSCETKLSKWENVLRGTLEELITENYVNLSVSAIGEVTQINNIEYNPIKMAILSIIWRMSISNHSFFSDYKLGPYEEKIRRHLQSGVQLQTSHYPVLISKAMIAGEFHSGLLMPISRGRYGNFTMQSVVLNGFLFDILITEDKPIPKEISMFCIKDRKPAFMVTREYSDYGLPLDTFQQRVKDKDVVEFFNKHD